jgi:hypothetical protein
LVVVILPSKWVGWLVVACMRVVDDARHVMPALASLNVKCADLGAAGVAALASALGGRTALASLDLGFNDLGAAGAAALASALGGRLAALASLGLSGAGLGAAGVAALAPPRCGSGRRSPRSTWATTGWARPAQRRWHPGWGGGG